ncbi:MAG: ribosomal protein S18P -alanine acetyltransferase [Polaromonas sp.]|jgi:ribosomal-protein-alanine N-acetyltransferase|nr:ribosomal protein S18P -alanine acetyltransferase [Polaromonas sp.]
MNAALASAQPFEARFDAITPAVLPAVLRVEQSAYAHPWSERNFLDSLQAGYQMQLLSAGPAEKPELLGYFVAMKGVDEVHLLNITVAPAFQRQGWARVMLDALSLWSRGQGAQWLWLEARVSNARARAVYESHGFRLVGMRRNYYPASAALPRGEDALVMSLAL